MTQTIFAANWKMHHGPTEARDFFDRFLDGYEARPERPVWFFPPAVSIEVVSKQVQGHPTLMVGAQNVYWEPKGAFTGELSVSMAKNAGAGTALVGHSERRHVFGETTEETALKVRALLDADMIPVLCIGEKLEEREAGATLSVIEEQLGALEGIDAEALATIVIAYEPVWAIGTGRNATPKDAADVHLAIWRWLGKHGGDGKEIPILYGGSVKPANATELLSEQPINGVLVGGASLDPKSWQQICSAGLD